jgi:hypothetical protein
MWIVRLALDRPYTFIVMALLIFILSPLIILSTATDIFPNVNIPVVSSLDLHRPQSRRNGRPADIEL